MAQPIKITKPEWILFADESGFNTSQKKDGHVGGQKFVVERGTTPQTMASTTDHKFTLLPFTSASGEAVCCAIIYQGKGTVPATWKTILRGMESKGVLTWMTMDMDGEKIYKNV